MDPLTHFLTGACMGRAGFNRKSALTTLTMVLAAEAADVDVLWSLEEPAGGVAAPSRNHPQLRRRAVYRGGDAGICVRRASHLAANAGRRNAARQSSPVRWGYLYLCRAARGAKSSSSGLHHRVRHSSLRAVQLSLVFVGPRVHPRSRSSGSCSSRDWRCLRFFGLINQEIGARSQGPRGRTGAIVALVCLVLIWGVRDYQHRRAVTAMDSFLYRGADAAARGCVSLHDQSVSLARRGGDCRLLRDRSGEFARSRDR